MSCQAFRVEPNVVTCSTQISACEGHWQKAIQLLSEMSLAKIWPNVTLAFVRKKTK